MITILIIFGLCHLSVNSHVNIPQPTINGPRSVVNVPQTNINHYLYELMGCYAASGYPCQMYPPFIEGHVTCLAKDQVCDGKEECPYGDDEDVSCGTRSLFCNRRQVRCNDGQCASVCNGMVECADGTDEENCDYFPCEGKNQVLCSDGKCAEVCDGKKECKNGEDELTCLPRCGDKEMVCPESGKCAKYCDGIPECDGKIDELFCPELPCDLVSLSLCFEEGFCRFNGYDLIECKGKARGLYRVSTYLLPCVEGCTPCKDGWERRSYVWMGVALCMVCVISTSYRVFDHTLRTTSMLCIYMDRHSTEDTSIGT